MSADSPTAIERVFYPPSPEPLSRRLVLSPLTALSWTYAAAVHLRGALYDLGLLRAERVEGLRVVSVGNLNVGGTGKTPAVLHLAELLVQAGRKVGILTRGYGRRSKEPLTFIGAEPLPSVEEAGDEPLLLARRCPSVRVFVNADRVSSAYRARDEYGLDTVLLDDGFQHRRLARDEDLVVVDEAVGLGNGHMLPRGPLREPASSLRRATLLWVRTSMPRVSDAKASSGDGLEVRAPELVPSGLGIPRVRARYGPAAWVDPEGNLRGTEALRGQGVLALAGLGRPGGFLKTLKSLGVEVLDAALYPDHHRFTAEELREVEARAARCGGRVVTTEKDAVRLPPGFAAWKVRLGVDVVEGEDHLRRALGLSAASDDL